jgi:hypothetical protein
MKLFPALLCLMLAACQSAPVPAPAPSAPPPARSQSPVEPAALPPVASERDAALRQQRAISEALLSQNEALLARVQELERSRAEEFAREVAPVVSAPIAMAEREERGPVVEPNAEGVIDLTALAAPVSDDMNPFVVRAAVAAAARESVFTIQGVVRGRRLVALINDQLVGVDEIVNGFHVRRIEPGVVEFEYQGTRLRMPVNGRSVRVRHT